VWLNGFNGLNPLAGGKLVNAVGDDDITVFDRT
jgi:hypothetical protein